MQNCDGGYYSNGNQSNVHFSLLCPAEELMGLVCTMGANDNDRNNRNLSLFHKRILKCRIIIFTTSHILAAPNPNNKREIFLLFHENVSNELKLREALAKIKLTVLRKTNVTTSIFEVCLKYTMEAKLSPLWNVVDNVFVKGRDFLLERSSLDAVEVNVFITNNVLRLELKSFKIILRQLNVEDLNISNKVAEYFCNVSDAKLSEISLSDQWIYVLPKLTKARIITVSRQMPISAQFGDYRELRRHWKNIYGYRLPDDEAGLLFYEIHFRPFGSELYTYPSICLRSAMPLRNIPTPSHSKDIIQSFLNDFKCQFPSVFGFSIDLKENDPLSTIIPYSNINEISYPMKKIEEKTTEFNPVPITDPLNHDNGYFTQNLSLCTQVPQNENVKKYFPIFLPKNNIKSIAYSVDTNILPVEKNIKLISENLNYKPMFQSDSFTSLDNQLAPLIPSFPKKIPNYPTKPFQSNTPVPKYSYKDNGNDKYSQLSQQILSQDSVKYSQEYINSLEENKENYNTPRTIVTPEELKIFNHFKTIKTPQVFGHLSNLTPQLSQNTMNIVTPKKRKCPEIDVKLIEEVPKYARTNPAGLKKLNKDVISSWLKSQNVHTRARMTKQQLLDKVFETINK